MVRTASAIGTLIGVALGVALVWSCTVNTRSDQLACHVQADCGSSGRVCENGYCVIDPSVKLDAAPDSPACPTQCPTCSYTDHSCMITGAGSGVTCPPGWNCTIECATPGACGSISCNGASSCNITCGIEGACGDISCGGSRCTIGCTGTGTGSGSGSGSTITACATVSCTTGTCDLTCTGGDACGSLNCGTGRCTQTCNGSGACGATQCSQSCDCNVSCNPDLGACGGMLCPMKGQHYCATGGAVGNACSSTAFPNCTTACP